jgi:hypothetical protein
MGMCGVKAKKKSIGGLIEAEGRRWLWEVAAGGGRRLLMRKQRIGTVNQAGNRERTRWTKPLPCFGCVVCTETGYNSFIRQNLFLITTTKHGRRCARLPPSPASQAVKISPVAPLLLLLLLLNYDDDDDDHGLHKKKTPRPSHAGGGDGAAAAGPDAVLLPLGCGGRLWTGGLPHRC